MRVGPSEPAGRSRFQTTFGGACLRTAAELSRIPDRLCLDLRPIVRYADRSKVGVLMSSSRFPIPQGTLDMLILQILSLEPAHGYGIAQRLDQISRAVVKVNQGSLYPALHRLEQKGWLRGEWKQSETGRAAEFYSLTASGRKQFVAEKDSWVRLAGAIQLIFNEGNR